MAKYTSKKNNHYIQAGWTGFGWGYQKSNNINRQDNRYNKVWTLKLNDIFEDNKIVSWLSFDELFKKGYISKEINAETNFYSNFLLLDDLDTDFAKDCEDFIVSVKEIESKIFSHFNGNIYLNANPFTIEDQKKLITELKSFIALHLSRTKLSVLRTFLEIDDLFINNSNSKSKILIPRNISEKELNEFNEMFSKVDENNYFEYKKKIAHFDINLNYKEIMKKMNNFTHIKFVAHQSISKNEVLNNFFLSEVPFFNQDFLQEEHKNNYKTHFVEFLKPGIFTPKGVVQYTQKQNNNIPLIKINFTELAMAVNISKVEYFTIIENIIKYIGDKIHKVTKIIIYKTLTNIY